MSKGRTFANDLLKLIYNATAIANIADNAAASPLTNIYAALHTAWPAETDSQNASECAYGSYARVAVARTTGGFTVTNDQVSPVATIGFPACTSGSESAMFFSTGVASSGATKILHRGVIGSRLGPFTGLVSDTIAIPGLSGLAVNDRIVFLTTNGSSLPTGLTEGTVYYVLSVSTDDITVSTTLGGSVVNLTTTGDGIAFKVTPLAITSAPQVTPQLSTGTTIYEE
jgi:hypothetical protein